MCGGTCAEDLDSDGICDDTDPCIGEEDADGNCNTVLGCTDAAAYNYDDEANVDDGSCLGWIAQANAAARRSLTPAACAVGQARCTNVAAPTFLKATVIARATNSTLVKCGGPGEIYNCGCFDQPEGDCDCDGNQLDAIDVCGGTCLSDINENGICDNVEFGCNDPVACNFISADLMDDGSCEYPEPYYNCAGECINDVNDNDICDELDGKAACRLLLQLQPRGDHSGHELHLPR